MSKLVLKSIYYSDTRFEVMFNIGIERKWANKWEFIVVSITILMGFGNFLKFPFLVLHHGGLAFIFPYTLFMVIIGAPMYYLDLSMGQFAARGTIIMFYNLSPAWAGVGVTQCIICFLMSSVAGYNISISLYYFINSFRFELPWTVCKDEWKYCLNSVETKNHSINNSVIYVSSSKYYFERMVLNKAETVEGGMNDPQYHLIIGVAATFVVCSVIIILGIKSFGKVAYFTAIFPFFIMFVLLMRAVTLPGAMTGIYYVFKFDWHLFTQAETWLNAASQCFLTFGIGSGVISTYASYHEVHVNNELIPVIVLLADLLASLLATLAIFGALGNYSMRMNIEIKEIWSSGTYALSYIYFSDVIGSFESANFVFSVVFFLMMATTSLGGLVAFQQALTTNLMEFYAKFNEWNVAILTCTVGFLSSIVYTCRAGLAVKNAVEMYGINYALLVVGTVEIIAVIFVYGLQYWVWDIEYMTTKPVSYYWRWSWTITSPACLVCVYIYACFITKRIEFNHRTIPQELHLFSIFLLCFVVLPIVIMIAYYMAKYRGVDGLSNAFNSEYWLPSNYLSAASSENFREEKWKAYPFKQKRKIYKDLLALCNQRTEDFQQPVQSPSEDFKQPNYVVP